MASLLPSLVPPRTADRCLDALVFRPNFRPDRQTSHLPPIAMIVVDGVMQRRAIVPDRELARLPSYAAAEFRLDAVIIGKIDEWLALFFRKTVEAYRVERAHIE